MARSIGLDVGTRRIGIAMSDTSKIIARPVEIIDRKRTDPLARIAALVAEHQADEVIVGYPYNADGTVGEQAQIVQQFAEALKARVAVPLRFYDERFSTSDAHDIISARRRKDQTHADDDIAAAVILQRYLDERLERAAFEAGDDGEADSQSL